MGVFENRRFLRKFRKKTFYFEKSKKILKKNEGGVKNPRLQNFYILKSV